MAKIKFTFEDKNIQPVEVDNIEKGLSILEVAEENDVHLNHNCGEVCACSTCHVYVLKGCLLYTSPSPRDRTRSRMPSSA